MRLGDLADVVRSKNAGAFEVTFDLLFTDPTTFSRVKESGVLSAKLFSDLFRVPEALCNFLIFERGLAFKCTIPRLVSSGDWGDTDVYGAQQYAPLLDVEVPD